MIRYYCDECGAELTSATRIQAFSGDLVFLKAKFRTGSRGQTTSRLMLIGDIPKAIGLMPDTEYGGYMTHAIDEAIGLGNQICQKCFDEAKSRAEVER